MQAIGIEGDLSSAASVIKSSHFGIALRDRFGGTTNEEEELGDMMMDNELQDAVEARDIARVKELLASGADVNRRDWYGSTPLHFAAMLGHREIVADLLAAGVDVNARNTWGSTALHAAARFGYSEIVNALLGSGADVSAKDDSDRTPSQWAERMGYHEIAAVLNQSRSAIVGPATVAESERRAARDNDRSK